jgi:hypothetical protein
MWMAPAPVQKVPGHHWVVASPASPVADTIFKEVKEQECPLCQAVYTEWKSLNRHIRLDHWTTCHLCFRTYKSRQYLMVHLGHFHRSVAIECDLATCFFRTKWALSASRHFTSQHHYGP